jgi:hypothetical protein
LQEDPSLFLRILNGNAEIPKSKEKLDFSGKLIFKNENYISKISKVLDKYDTILCLSTIKWIHLNYGDVGV